MTGKMILDALVKDIDSQAFADSGKLPSEADLCKRFGASRMTVRVALAELQRRGLIEKRNGAGSFLTRRALRRSGVIGLVIPDFHHFEFFAAMQKEILRHCARLNYRVELITTDKSKREEIIRDIRHQVRKLATLRVEGVIFRPYVSDDFAAASREVVRILDNAEIPVVLTDSDILLPPERSDCDMVTVDNIAAGRRIARHLYERNYRRIAFLTKAPAYKMNANYSNRLFGLAGELALLGAENAVHTLACKPDDGRAIAAILKGRFRPDAIVCGNDDLAVSLLATLKKLHKRVPQDIAVTGFDNSERARLSDPPLTTISQPVGKLAATAFKTLLARIRYPDNDPRETYLDAPLVVRSST